MTRDLGQFDLIVVGGGVNGAGIARDAAGRGLSVLLCEKGDLAQGTSSRSGKLVHGGLRYLEYYEFRLVREALIEREVLLRAAPHIIWPMRFVLPHSPEQRPAWMVRAGLFLYDHLGGRRILPPTRSLDLSTAPEGEPIRKNFTRAFEYSDCWVDDARLVVLNAIDVRNRGGAVLTRTSLESARREGDQWRVEMRNVRDGQSLVAAGRVIVNAAGPWVEDVLHRAGRNAESRVRLVKGSHIITRKFWTGDQAYLLQHSDKRVIFVNPYEGDLALIGTTDIPFEGRAEDVRVDPDEIEYLLSVVERYFENAPKAGDVVHAFSGVRPLFDDKSANPERGDARLCLRRGGAGRTGADAVCLRRQDHHLSEAFGARSGKARALFSQDGGSLDGACAFAGRGHSRRRFLALFAGAASADAPGCRRKSRAAMGAAMVRGSKASWRAPGRSATWGACSAGPFMNVRRASLWRTNGRWTPRTFSSGEPNTGCISRTMSARSSRPGSKWRRHRRYDDFGQQR